MEAHYIKSGWQAGMAGFFASGVFSERPGEVIRKFLMFLLGYSDYEFDRKYIERSSGEIWEESI